MKNKIKKLMYIVLVMLALVSLLACGNNTKTDISGNGATLDDTQPYFDPNFHQVAKSDKGYYFIRNKSIGRMKKSHEFLCFWDSSSGECIELCGKAECDHKNENCDAYLGEHEYMMNIYFYQNKLYLIKRAGSRAILEEVNPDGTDRKEVGDVGIAGEGIMSNRLSFCGDTVYIYDVSETDSMGSGNRTVHLYRMSLTDGKKEVVYEYTGVLAIIKYLRSYGDNVYYIVDYKIENGENKDGIQQYKMAGKGLMQISGTTGEITNIIDEIVTDYAVDMENNNLYYYVYAKGLYKKSMDTGKSELIYKADGSMASCCMSYDGNNIYIDNEDWKSWGHTYGGTPKYEKKYLMLDKQGKEIAELDMQSISRLIYGDDKYLFAVSKGYELCYTEKSKLPEINWQCMTDE